MSTPYAKPYAMRLQDVVVRFQEMRRIFGGRRGGFEALRGITVDVVRGEKLGIVGSNGAGKSTLMRVLAGVLVPDSGSVERHHGTCSLLALGSGFMPQLSGRENAVLSGLVLGMERRRVVSRLEAIKRFSELGEFFEAPVRTYSSGMRSRLGFSVAIQQQPDILLIDETLAVGDARFNTKSKTALRERLNEDATVVVVSHSRSTIEDICDRVLWLEGGETQLVGAPKEVMKQYQGDDDDGD